MALADLLIKGLNFNHSDGIQAKEETPTIKPTNILAKAFTMHKTNWRLSTNYELILYAYDPKTGNTGVDKINYVIYK